MFIVFGSPRSGTTLLASSLDQSDHLVVPHETDFIIPMAFIVDRVREPGAGRQLVAEMIVKTERFAQSLGEYVTADEVREAVAKADYTFPAMLKAIYAKVASRAGRRMAGDKSPNDVAYSRILLKNGMAQSGIKVIHIVRDVRDVLLSLNEAQPQDWPDIRSYFPRMWSYSNLLVHDSLRSRPDSYFFLRYEDLVTDPERAFRGITDFLGVPYRDRILDAAARSAKYEHMPHHRNLTQPILQRRGNWREAMSPELKSRCVVQAREGLARFGYETE
jgi:hypothetical protein